MTDTSTLNADRSAMDRAEAELRAAEHRLFGEERTLEDKRRRDPAVSKAANPAATDGPETAKSSLALAKESYETARRQYEQTAAELVAEQSSADPLDQLAGDKPIVLFPVRLETRLLWDGTIKELRVRIFPEELHIDTHEPELTDEELDWGQAYQTRTAGATVEAEASAWAELAQRFGSRRAAWIVRAVESGDPIDMRAASWTRPPRTDLMPDRWIVIGYEDGVERFRVMGEQVPPRLMTGWDPQSGDQGAGPDELHVDDGMRWLVDFDEAERVGMAVRVDLTDYPRDRVDQLLAVGVKVSAGDAADLVERQLEALHYTAGLGFLPQGLATNNAETASSAFNTDDPGHLESFRLERQPTALSDGTSGARLADALGVDRSIFENARLASMTEEPGAEAMNTALWSATWGHYLDHMIRLQDHAGANAAADREAVYELFRNHVRARGPLSVVNVGNQPYGMLPLVSIEHWQPMAGEASDERLRPLLQVIRQQHWRVYSADLHQLGDSDDPADDLVNILGQSAVPMHFGVRQLLGEQVLRAMADANQYKDVDEVFQELWSRLSEPFGRLGIPSTVPIARSLFNTLSTIDVPLVDLFPLSATDPLVNNYIDEVGSASMAGLQAGLGPVSARVLLANLLRHAKLAAYGRAMVAEAKDLGVLDPTFEPERELIGVQESDTGQTVWDLLEQTFPGSNQTFEEVYQKRSEGGGHIASELSDLDRSLLTLSTVPSAELDLLFRETMALCSYRLDAWTTGYATKRLGRLRDSQSSGVYLGGFGFLMDLVVPSADELDAEDGAPSATVGYTHAPSIDQATAAALLRSGHQAREGETGDNPFDIDLSSERVRAAKQLMDGVRDGLPLGGLLGYRLERDLQDRGLHEYLPTLRNAFPPVAGKERPETQPAEMLAAANTIDGLALLRNMRQAREHNQANPTDPPQEWQPDYAPLAITPDERAEIQAAADQMEAALDAVGDAVTAESVFQIVRGNPSRAGATVDSVANGEVPPPELESMRTPRRGVELTHRVVIPLQRPATAGPPKRNARAKAAPLLDDFAATIIGDLTRYSATATFLDPEDNETGSLAVSLEDLGLDPLDLVYLAATSAGGFSELEMRLADHALNHRPAGVTADAKLRLDLDPDGLGVGEVSAANLVEMANKVHAMIAGSRPMTDEDLTLRAIEATASIDVAELQGRADQASDALVAATTDLAQALAPFTIDPSSNGESIEPDQAAIAQLRSSLFAVAAFGVPGAVPAVAADGPGLGPALIERAGAVLDAASHRVSDAQRLSDEFDPAVASEAEMVAHHTARLGLVFDDTVQVLPRFAATNGTEVAAAFASQSTLLDGDAMAPETLLAGASKFRPNVQILQQVRDYAQALDADVDLEPMVAQLPFSGPADRWVGLSRTPDRSGTVSLVALSTAEYDPAEPVAGLFIDFWEEVVPSTSQVTGLTFNFDAPNSEPPNAILLAVPPRPGENWALDDLVMALRELMYMVPYRVGDPQKMHEIGHMLPAAFLAFNPEGHVVSTDMAALTND